MDRRQWPYFDRRKGPLYLSFLVGIWLILAPFVLGYTHLAAPFWNDVTVGLLVTALAALRIANPPVDWASWGSLILGAWLWLAPVLFRYTPGGAPAANDFTVGLLLFFLATWSLVRLQGPCWESTFVSAEPDELP